MAKRSGQTISVDLPKTSAGRPKMSRDELMWQAQSDARTLADAAAIRADKKRMDLCAKAAAQMAKEQMEKARAMVSIAKQKKGRR